MWNTTERNVKLLYWSRVFPPMGFEVNPMVKFLGDSEYPTACTCALELTLPMKHYKSLKEFHEKWHMLKNHEGFGLLTFKGNFKPLAL